MQITGCTKDLIPTLHTRVASPKVNSVSERISNTPRSSQTKNAVKCRRVSNDGMSMISVAALSECITSNKFMNQSTDLR